jgi:hypothetical protein
VGEPPTPSHLETGSISTKIKRSTCLQRKKQEGVQSQYGDPPPDHNIQPASDCKLIPRRGQRIKKTGIPPTKLPTILTKSTTMRNKDLQNSQTCTQHASMTYHLIPCHHSLLKNISKNLRSMSHHLISRHFSPLKNNYRN